MKSNTNKPSGLKFNIYNKTEVLERFNKNDEVYFMYDTPIDGYVEPFLLRGSIVSESKKTTLIMTKDSYLYFIMKLAYVLNVKRHISNMYVINMLFRMLRNIKDKNECTYYLYIINSKNGPYGNLENVQLPTCAISKNKHEIVNFIIFLHMIKDILFTYYKQTGDIFYSRHDEIMRNLIFNNILI